MKKLLLVSTFLVLAGALFATTVVHAQTGGCTGGSCTYVPLEPLPGVNQTGLNFANYVSGMFRLFITLGALFSVLMLVIAGIGYMISESGVEIGKAKQRMWAALYGLLILTACWLILYTINPNLLRFDLFTSTLNTVAQKNTSPNIPATSQTGGDANTNGTIYAAPVPRGAIGSGLLIQGGSSPENIQKTKDFFENCTTKLGGSDVTFVDSGSGANTIFCIK